MKNFWIVLFLSGFLFSACKNEKNGGDTPPPQSVQGNPIGGSAAPALAPGASLEAQILTRDFWVTEFYVIPGDRAGSQANRGRWFVFHKDGTFNSGHWEEQTGSGTWTLRKESGKPILRLDNVNDADDSEWELKINDAGDAMSWVGTKTYKQSSIMVKVINLLSMPTKAQFGLQ